MPKKTYLRSPSDDYAPDNNIQLGHVWRDPRDPGSFIGAPLPIPEDIKVNHTYKGSWTIDLGRESHGEIGLWAKVAQLFVTAGASIQWDNAEDGAYMVPRMDTYSIEPTSSYVEASVASISAEILKTGDNLYMITGVKIARGAEGSNKESKNFGTDTRVGVDTTATGAPVQVGEHVSYSKGAHNSQGFGSTGDFVFAYRVREIFYKKGVLKTMEYNKGAVLGEDMIPVGKNEGELRYAIEDVEVGDDDVEVDGELYSFIDDDGVECDIWI
ncbi:hypothetical protein DL765_009368 [Monosporascus sp. GIB2]|nr:hypothetical protein DL765_009368 [Monosporascus sp. GIB2]